MRPDGGAMAVLRAVLAFSVLAMALVRAVPTYAATVPAGGDPWMAGEWLINYADGFVRRGLFGELFLAWAPGGEAGLWVLFWFQICCYLVVLAYAVEVLNRTRYSWSSIALVCGPAGLAFIGWDTNGGFRKEVLVFVVLALLAWSRRPRRTPVVAGSLVGGAFVLYVLAVFSWEPAALLLPAVGYLLLTGNRPLLVFRRSAAALFAVVGLLGGLAGALAHGDVGAALAICSDVRAHGYDGVNLCGAQAVGGGGVDAIGWTRTRALEDVAASFPAHLGYVPLIALALVPVVASDWFRDQWRWGVAVALGVVPMYLLVTDYGRWTHIVVIALMFCVTAEHPSGAFSTIWNAPVTLLYVSLWAMPHHLGPWQTPEWGGLLHTVVTSLIRDASEVLNYPLAPGLAREAQKP